MNKPGYAQLMPAQPQDSRVIFDYDIMKREASRLSWYTQVQLNPDVALALAMMSPYPQGVRLGVMKQLANDKAVTLRQMSILLGWAANKAQR